MGGETKIQQGPTTPAPSASESAADIYKSRLQYDPLVAQQEMDIQKQMLPQQSALYQSLYNQYYPEVARQQQSLQQELYPFQSQIVEQGAQEAINQLRDPQTALMSAMEQQARVGMQPNAMASLAELQAISGLQPNALLGTAEQQARGNIIPSQLQRQIEQQAQAGLTQTGYTPEQQAAVDAIRQRMAAGLSKQLRERSNLGGTLYGGRSQQLESQGLQELGQRFAAEDIDRLQAQRNMAIQQALAAQGAGLEQRQQGLAGLTGVAGMQEAQRQAGLSGLMSIAQLRPNLLQQALAAAGQVSAQQLQARQSAQQALNPYMQILYPQVGTQQPQIQPYQYQSAVPQSDTLYNAMFKASQPELFASQAPDRLGQLMGLGGQLGGAAIAGALISSERYKKNIKLWA